MGGEDLCLSGILVVLLHLDREVGGERVFDASMMACWEGWGESFCGLICCFDLKMCRI